MRALRSAWHHVYAGTNAIVLAFGLLLLMMYAIDLYRYNADHSLLGSLFFLSRMPRREVLVAGGFLLSLLFVVAPSIVTIALVLFSKGNIGKYRLLRSSPALFVVNIMVCLAVPIGLAHVNYMEVLAGYSLSENLKSVAFVSMLHGASVVVIQAGYFLVTLLAGHICVILLNDVGSRLSGGPEIVKAYASRFSLIELGAELMPVCARDKAVFTAGGMAPEIRHVKKHADRLYSEYQKKVPGSIGAENYLLELSRRSKEAIAQKVLPDCIQEDANIELYSSTSRALEVALLKRGPSQHIILSPFEHPSEIAVAKWLGRNLRIKTTTIHFYKEDYGLPDDAVAEKLTQKIVHATDSGSEPVTLVISDMFYADGRIVPTQEINDKTRASSNKLKSMFVILDGAHSVGNLSNKREELLFDCFVFSAHKWLLSPEPCGILVNAGPSSKDKEAYDTWGTELPKHSASARMICGLNAALGLWDKTRGLGRLQRRATFMVQYLLERMPDKLEEATGDNKSHGGHILALRPKAGYRWDEVDPRMLRKKLENEGIYITTVRPAAPVWIRLTFPYFGDYGDVDRIRKVLAKYAVRPAAR